MVTNCTNKGFTLLEVIAAIFILTVGVGSAFILISQTLSATSLVRERLIASYLVQEGIEIVRNIRDGNWLEGENFDQGISPGDYEVDYLSQDLTLWGNRYLKVDPSNPSNGFYNYLSGNPTIYARKITIEKPEESTSTLRVSAEVFWQEKGRPHSIKAREELRDWKP